MDSVIIKNLGAFLEGRPLRKEILRLKVQSQEWESISSCQSSYFSISMVTGRVLGRRG